VLIKTIQRGDDVGAQNDRKVKIALVPGLYIPDDFGKEVKPKRKKGRKWHKRNKQGGPSSSTQGYRRAGWLF